MEGFVAGLAILLSVSGLHAQEAEEPTDEFLLEEEAPEAGGLLAPNLTLGVGFQFYDVDGDSGAKRAVEYEHPVSWPFVEGAGGWYTMNHRVQFEGLFKNLKDWSGDIYYGYKDMVLVRVLGSGLRHNLDRFDLVDIDPSGPRYSTQTIENLENPGLDGRSVHLSARVKMPNYPAHVYVEGWMYNKRADRNLDFLGGSNNYDDLQRTRRRDALNALTTDLTVGANAHVGPVEIDFAHTEFRFDRISDTLSYAYSGGLPGGSGLFNHNVIPELSGRKERIMIHTSYSGRIVGAASATLQSRKNRFSEVDGTMLRADASLTYHPVERLTLSARYDLSNVDWTAPDTVTLAQLDANLPIADQVFDITREPVKYTKHSVRGILRYRVLKGVVLRAEVHNDFLDRDNFEEWHLSSQMNQFIVYGRLSIRPSSAFELDTTFEHKTLSAPSHNTEPDNRNRLQAEMAWSPAFFAKVRVHYEFARDSRTNLEYRVRGQEVLGERRELDSHHIYGAINVAAADGLVFSGIYGYATLDNEQTIAFENFASTPPDYLLDSGAEYRESVHLVSGDASYRPFEPLTLGVRGSYSIGNTAFRPALTLAVVPTSVGEFSETKGEQLRLEAYARLIVEGGWQFALFGRRHEANFRTSIYNPTDDGRVHVIAASVAKKF